MLDAVLVLSQTQSALDWSVRANGFIVAKMVPPSQR